MRMRSFAQMLAAVAFAAGAAGAQTVGLCTSPAGSFYHTQGTVLAGHGRMQRRGNQRLGHRHTRRQPVASGAAVDPVGRVAADQEIVSGSTFDQLGALSAEDHVVPAERHDPVVATLGANHVGPLGAEKDVVAGRAHDGADEVGGRLARNRARLLAGLRRRGPAATGLLATRLKEIRERGYRYAVVEAGAMSMPIVAKHGFQHLTTVHDYEWKGN